MGSPIFAVASGGALSFDLISAYTFPEASAGHTFSSLDGDTDDTYMLTWRVLKNSIGQIDFDLAINGVSTATEFNMLRQQSSGDLTQTTSKLKLASAPSTDGLIDRACTGWLMIKAKSGMHRTMVGAWSVKTGTGASAANLRGGSIFGIWAETSTPVSSLGFLVDTGGTSIRSGVVSLYTVRRS